MSKKVITGILLAALTLGLGYSIYEFFFISFPRGILDASFLWVAIPMRIWAPVFVIVAIVLVGASYLLARKK